MTHYTNTENQDIILISDGSNHIYHVDPSNFKVIKTVSVFDERSFPLNNLNELEMYRGTLLANIFEENYIA